MIINGLVNDGLMYNESKRLPNRQRELECCCCVEYKHSSNSLCSTRFISHYERDITSSINNRIRTTQYTYYHNDHFSLLRLHSTTAK